MTFLPPPLSISSCQLMQCLGCIGLAATIATASGFVGSGAALAGESNFGEFRLNAKTRARVVDGSTGGATSLTAMTTDYDRNDNQCFGFGAPKPDHILVLNRKIKRLKLVVDSRGKDTTLVIQAPDGTFLCADDFGGGKDAGLDEPDWLKGKYKIWVGSITPNLRSPYRLKVQAF